MNLFYVHRKIDDWQIDQLRRLFESKQTEIRSTEMVYVTPPIKENAPSAQDLDGQKKASGGAAGFFDN